MSRLTADNERQISMTSITKFGDNGETVALVSKATGEDVGARLMRQREFGVLHGIKGQELKRKYREFFLSAGGRGAKVATARYCTGDYLLEQVRENPKNGKVTLTMMPKSRMASGVVDDLDKSKKDMAYSDLSAAIAKLEAELAARKAAASALEITDADVAAAAV